MIVAQIISLGFSQEQIEAAIRKLPKDPASRTVQRTMDLILRAEQGKTDEADDVDMNAPPAAAALTPADKAIVPPSAAQLKKDSQFHWAEDEMISVTLNDARKGK